MRTRATIALAAALGGLVLAATVPSGAQITSPGAGSTVRGDVTISEDTGAEKPFYCTNTGIYDTITVRRNGDGTVVHTDTKQSPGAHTTVWVSHGQPIGDYTLKSVAVNKDFLCNLSSPVTRSEFGVHLENLSDVTYTGATAAPILGFFTASALLDDATSGRPIEGRGVAFAFDGRPIGACVTDANGACSAQGIALGLPGQHTLTTSFAGDCCWVGSSVNTTFTVTLPVLPY
jgi:hypothetical protein